MEEQPSVIGVGRDSWQDSVVDRMCVKSEDREGRTGRLNTMKKKKITERVSNMVNAQNINIIYLLRSIILVYT